MNNVENFDNFDNFDIANQWGQFIDIDHHAPIFTKNKVNIPYTIMENDSVRNYSSESTPLSPLSPPISQYIIHNPTNNNTTITTHFIDHPIIIISNIVYSCVEMFWK